MRVSFKTFGCRLNQAETARYEALFKANRIETVPFGRKSDACIIHSCSVTSRAESECLRTVRAVKRKHPGTLVALAGCAVESTDDDKLAALGIDLIIPRDDKERLVEIILDALNEVYTPPGQTVHPSFSTHRALLKVQDGCSFFCSYCIIPHNRGAPVSRDFRECLDEARAFIDSGFREIVVTGCNIACYNDSGRKLPELVRAIASLPGVGRVRCGSIEPGTVELAMAELMTETNLLCPFLHLPFQHCDDNVLKRMNRRYTVADMRATIERILERLPRVSLGSDIITGFPGEDPDAFAATKTFIRNYPFSNLHVFPYSERQGTAAAKFDETVPHAVRKERARELIELGSGKRMDYAATWSGSDVEMLVESFDDDGNACGWSAEYLPCRVSGIAAEQQDAVLGKLLRFQVEAVQGDVLEGKIE